MTTTQHNQDRCPDSPAGNHRSVDCKGSPLLSFPVPKLCQNSICLGHRELLFEREQLPQVVDNRHFRIELMECLEPEIILRKQQGPGSAGASRSITWVEELRATAWTRVDGQWIVGFRDGEDRPQRTMPVRQRQEVQALLRLSQWPERSSDGGV